MMEAVEVYFPTLRDCFGCFASRMGLKRTSTTSTLPRGLTPCGRSTFDGSGDGSGGSLPPTRSLKARAPCMLSGKGSGCGYEGQGRLHGAATGRGRGQWEVKRWPRVPLRLRLAARPRTVGPGGPPILSISRRLTAAPVSVYGDSYWLRHGPRPASERPNMRTYHVIDCTKLTGTSATLFGPRFVARLAAWGWTMATGRYHDFIRGEG